MSMIKQIALSKIVPNPDNPRIIKDDKFLKLVQSIKDFPEMLSLRPIVVNADMMVLGGNMRLKACKEAGLKEVPVMQAKDLTEAQQKEFIIKDNVGFGEWDFDALANGWDAEDLDKWGLDVPDFSNNETDYSDKNKEIDIDELDSDMIIKLKYVEDEYEQVKEALSKVASTPEQAVWKLLKL